MGFSIEKPGLIPIVVFLEMKNSGKLNVMFSLSSGKFGETSNG